MTVSYCVPNARIVLSVASLGWAGMMLSSGHDAAATLLGSTFALHALALYGLSLLALAAFPRARRGDVWLGALALAWLLMLARFALGLACDPLTLPADGLGLAAAFAPTYVEDFRRSARSGLRRVDRRRYGLRRPVDGVPVSAR